MKNEKEFNKGNEINEEELSQVSGGAGTDGNYHYRCKNCGAEEWFVLPFKSVSGPTCINCSMKLGYQVFMFPADD